MEVRKFIDYLRLERNYSAKTIEGYSDDLRAFEKFFKETDAGLSWDSIDADIIRDWMEHMMDKGNTATSINRRLSALRSFYRFALAREMVTKDPAHGITGPKKEKPLPQFLKENEINALLDEKMWNFDDYINVRARTIIMIFYETGLRVSELAGLDDNMADTANCSLKVTGKRNKQRIIPFGEELKRAIEQYRTIRDNQVPKLSQALLLTRTGERMSTPAIRREVVKQISRVSTIKKRTPHVLRHTFATAMLNHGAGIESVKELLGHASVATTEIYTHTTFEQLKKVYKSAHPRA